MKTAVLLLLCCLSAFAQSPDTIKYAPRQLLLVDPTPCTEAVLPMLVTTGGTQHLEFVPVHQIKEFLDKGGRPVTLSDILSILGVATEKVNQLQAENDRLWKVAMKDAPKSETVIVQEAAPSAPSQAQIAAQQQAEANARRQQILQMWMTLQNANRTQNLNVNVTNCTRYPALCVGR
jgi:hypothetical protein